MSPQDEQPISDPEEAKCSMMARAIYKLLLGALAVAEKDEDPGAAELRAMIASAADAYFPLTGLEEPAWVRSATGDVVGDAGES